MLAFVGSITADPSQGEVGPGVSVLEVEPSSGALALRQQLGGLQSPTYLALHPRLRVLYAGERYWPPMGATSPGTGAITSFAIAGDGTLTRSGTLETGGATHLNVQPAGRFLVAPMNRIHTVGVFPLADDGRVGPPVAQIVHAGRGPVSPNQDTAFPHSCWFDPSGKRVLCCDLAQDRVLVYAFDPSTGALQPNEWGYAQVSSGAGPRHLAFLPGGDVVYVLNELDSTISVFGYEAATGKLAILQTISALPEDFTGRSAAAQIMVHPEARMVYASNRGHDSIARFSIAQDGRLHLEEHVPSGGERPHNFTLDSTGTLMLVANQRSNRVVSFHINRGTGALTPTGHALEIPLPVCIVVG
jgi:6-phosphogluconolactonase